MTEVICVRPAVALFPAAFGTKVPYATLWLGVPMLALLASREGSVVPGFPFQQRESCFSVVTLGPEASCGAHRRADPSAS